MTEDSEFREENVTSINSVSSMQSGRPGRPKKNVDPNILQEVFKKGRRISLDALSSILGVHRNTLRSKIKELDINTGFDDISDNELDQIVRLYRLENPDAGRGYVTGYLQSKGLRIQRWCISKSIARVDRLGQGLRNHVGKKKTHDTYSVPRPNALWHIDGHHKLIHWGIVIHGVADGYSRKVLWFIPVFKIQT